MAKFEANSHRESTISHIDVNQLISTGIFFAMCCLDGQGSLPQSLPAPIQGQRKDSGFWSSYEVATANMSHHFDAPCRAMCSRTSLQSLNLPCPFQLQVFSNVWFFLMFTMCMDVYRLFLKLFRATMRQCLDPKLCARASLALGAMPLFDSVDDVSVSENEPWSRLGRLVFSNFSTCFLLHPAQKGQAIDIRSAAAEPPSDEVCFFSFVLGLGFLSCVQRTSLSMQSTCRSRWEGQSLCTKGTWSACQISVGNLPSQWRCLVVQLLWVLPRAVSSWHRTACPFQERRNWASRWL